MKTAAVCVVCAAGAFFAMHLHLSGQLGGADEAAEKADEKKEQFPPTKFPLDLAPAARGEPAPRAAAFTQKYDTHPTAVLTVSGRLHEWHSRLQPDWQADSVETTELVLVVAPQKKTLLQIVPYGGGAPPVRRYRHDLDVWLVEARTGQQIASRRFWTEARPCMPQERWELTELGDPVECAPVLEWLREQVANYAERAAAAR
jgi:hypothetical protein